MHIQMVMPIAVTPKMESKFVCHRQFKSIENNFLISLYAHSHVITTGSDGDIRIWNGVDDDDPNTRCVGEFVLYHVYYENRILASTDLNTVQAYTYPDGDRDGTEFRFTASVTCIKVNDKVNNRF